MLRCRTWLIAFWALLAPLALAAQDTQPPAPYAYTQLDDPALEAQAVQLMASLRCLTCQSQSIADSDAPMAGDMRHQVRARLLAGESPAEIRAWLTERYGDYVSYAPQVNAVTWPLFAVPLGVIGLALLVLVGRLRRKTKGGTAA
ncbi:MAG: cytochrome c-type biogenesis protein [Pseudomonadota bacterium]